MYSKKRFLSAVLAVFILMPAMISIADGASAITPIQGGQIELEWTVHHAPSEPFALFWCEGENWLSSNDSIMFFTVDEVTAEAAGELIIGNATVTANDTMIARDLVFGVWGATEWWPGLIVTTGTSAIDQLNQTAYASAERVAGNYLNGTMISYYDNVTASGTEYECIVFEYIQDPVVFGEPQETYLAYSLDSGVLIKGNSSVTFSQPYLLEVEFSGYRIWTPFGVGEYLLIGGIVILLISGVAIMQKRIKKPER